MHRHVLTATSDDTDPHATEAAAMNEDEPNPTDQLDRPSTLPWAEAARTATAPSSSSDPGVGTQNAPEPHAGSTLRRPWECEVWWCDRPAGHDRPTLARHTRAVGKTVVSTTGCRVGVAIYQDGNDPAAVIMSFEAPEGLFNVATLDPTRATVLARSIRPAELDTYDPHEHATPIAVWVLTNPERPDLVTLDPASGQQVARRIDRAVSILTEQTGWGLGPPDIPHPWNTPHTSLTLKPPGDEP